MPKMEVFTHEDLDRMYDEAMRWQPASTGNPVAPATDPRQVLQRLIANKKAQQQLNINQGQTING